MQNVSANPLLLHENSDAKYHGNNVQMDDSSRRVKYIKIGKWLNEVVKSRGFKTYQQYVISFLHKASVSLFQTFGSDVEMCFFIYVIWHS